MKDKLSPEIIQVYNTLKENNQQVYLVGGCVRDKLLGRNISDFDFTTDASPEKIQAIFKRTIPTGLQHGTVTVLINRVSFEVTTYRTEGKYSNFRKPEQVQFVKNLKEDLKRRDFTINALAYDYFTDKIIDLFDGKRDLEKKVIRTIGDPDQRFNEDALRMMRACRFASQLDFTISDEVISSIQKLKKNILKIPIERIREEFIKIILSPKPSKGLEQLRVSGLLELLFPALQKMFGCSQNKFHQYDVYYHSLHVLDAIDSDDYRLRLSALFHDIAKPVVKKNIAGKAEPVFYNHEIVGAGMTKRIMRQYKFSNQDTTLVVHLVKQHMFHYSKEWNDGAVRRFINRIDPKNLPLLWELRRADRLGSGVKSADCEELVELRNRIALVLEKDNALKISDLKINGNIIIKKFQLKPSRLLGDILNHLLELVLEHPEKNKEELLLAETEFYLKTKAK